MASRRVGADPVEGTSGAVDPDAAAAATTDGGASTGRRLHALYGASPGHLVAVLACLLVAAYTVSRLFGSSSLLRIGVWFVGAAVAWDLVGGPLVALVDRGLQLLRRTGGGVALVNHVRAPLGISALLLLLWTPVIFQRSERTFMRRSGLDEDPFLGRWVLVTVGLFALSAALYALRVWRARTRETA